MIEPTVPGVWWVVSVVRNRQDYWAIVNRKTGRTKVIGRTRAKKTNYFDRAVEEANKRNTESS